MDSRISKEDFLEAFKIIDSKFNNLPSIEIHITRFTAEVKMMESKLNTYNKLHNLPRLSFSVITPSDDNDPYRVNLQYRFKSSSSDYLN